MNKELFEIELNKLNIHLSEEQKKKLDIYANFLIEYNNHTNLTSITNIEDIYLKHFYDSITIIKAINLNEVNTLLDIGTGAGFPGMVIKIIYPNINVTLLDSNNKKILFLRELSNKLDLEVNLIHDRAENFINNNRESFDIVVSRAVAQLNILLELAIPFLKVGGYFIAMKSHAKEEIDNSTSSLTKLNSIIEDIIELELPIEKSKRTLIKIKKNDKTELQYPRLYDKIKKQPL